MLSRLFLCRELELFAQKFAVSKKAPLGDWQ